MYANDAIREAAIEQILTWDYEKMNDLAPWDYDENTITGSGRGDAEAFVIEFGWTKPAAADPKAFEAAFLQWYRMSVEAKETGHA